MPPPGATEIASQSLDGDHSTEFTGSSSAVTRVGQPPSLGTLQTWGRPLMSQTKAKVFPSGEKVGEPHRPMRAIKVTVFVNSSVAVGVGVCAVSMPKLENWATAIMSARMSDLRSEKRAQDNRLLTN